MSFEDEERLIEKVLQLRPDITRDELEKLVQSKIQEFGGIIGRDAALLLVAKELGVPVLREAAPRSLAMLRIRDLAVGFRGVDLEGILVAKTPVLQTREGKPYLRFLFTDGEDGVWGVAWGDAAQVLANARIFSKLLLRKVSVVRRKGRLELSLSQTSQVEVKGLSSVESITELLSRLRAKVDILSIKRVVEGSQGKIVYCFDRQCKPVGLLLPPESETPALSGWVVVSNYFEERLGELRILKCRKCVFEEFSEYAGTACREDTLSEVTTRGTIACYTLFRKSGGRVFLIDRTGATLELLAFSDAQLLDTKRMLGSEVEVLGVVKSGSGLKSTPITIFRKLSNTQGSISYRKVCLLGATGPVEVEASIISLRLKYRCIEGAPLYQVSFRVDDGTASLQATSNAPVVLRKLYGVDEQELCEMGPGAVNSIAEYMSGELLGADVLLRGQIIGTTERLLSVQEVELIS